MITIEYLEEERVKLWNKLLEVEKKLNKKTSDYEKEAKSSSKKTSEYRNKCKESLEVANDYISQISTKISEIDESIKTIKHNEGYSIEKSNEIKTILDASNENLETLNEKKLELQKSIEFLELAFENHPNLEDEIETLNSAFHDSEELNTKIQNLHKNSLTRKREIDNLYYEINGYSDTDEDTEEETEVEGLKEKLEKTYVKLKSNLDILEKKLSDLQTRTEANFNKFQTTQDIVFNENLKKWQNKYSSIENKINSLLPNALTAGLSSAYSTKKTEETAEQVKLVKRFNWGIFGLILVSLIPFAVSIKSISDGLALDEVLTRMPRLVLAILPLYIPVMWVAYSANRKMNLSKRLIEEYSHKEVISKTFEGLSKQINDIEDSETSSDLRLKLLYNILEVSSENPGKLISNYNKSDHPIMDALDKSVKLSNAVEKLADIPGLSSLSKVLDKKSKKILAEQAEKVDKVLNEIGDDKQVES